VRILSRSSHAHHITGTIEIGVLRADQTALEVELDRRLRGTDVDDETVADE
jgi:hypothetical protein